MTAMKQQQHSSSEKSDLIKHRVIILGCVVQSFCFDAWASILKPVLFSVSEHTHVLGVCYFGLESSGVPTTAYMFCCDEQWPWPLT
jgi:hypothetical protein